jgi:hypothetical protein
VPKAVYESLGLYLPYFRVSADYEYAFHLWRHGVEFVDLPSVLALFREGGMSAGITGNWEALETCAHYLGRPWAAAICGEALMKKGRLAAVSRVLGPERTATLRSTLKALTRAS